MNIRSSAQKLRQLRLVHFVTVGAVAFAAEYASFLLLFYTAHRSATIAQSVSFCLGLAVSFAGNKTWVFGGKQQKRLMHQFALYLGLAVINLLITNVAIHYAVQAGTPAFVVKFLLICLVATWNFVFFRRFIFRPID